MLGPDKEKSPGKCRATCLIPVDVPAGSMRLLLVRYFMFAFWCCWQGVRESDWSSGPGAVLSSVPGSGIFSFFFSVQKTRWLYLQQPRLTCPVWAPLTPKTQTNGPARLTFQQGERTQFCRGSQQDKIGQSGQWSEQTEWLCDESLVIAVYMNFALQPPVICPTMESICPVTVWVSTGK